MKLFRLERHGRLLMAKSFIEGPAGKAYPKLLVDTGSAYSVVAQEILENIGLSPAMAERRQRVVTGSGYEIVPVVIAEKFQCFGKTMVDFEMLAHTLPLGSFVDGLLGMDFMSRCDMDLKISTCEVLVK